MTDRRNEYLDISESDLSPRDGGYDLEVNEPLKGGRSGIARKGQLTKRRKVSQARSDDDEEDDLSFNGAENPENHERETHSISLRRAGSVESENAARLSISYPAQVPTPDLKTDAKDLQPSGQPLDEGLNESMPSEDAHATVISPLSVGQPSKLKFQKTANRPGIVYLSSLPPYLRPSALRNLVEARGFGPIDRMFLTPSPPSSKKSNKRKSYTEAWLLFSSHTTAKVCVQTLNATPIGGKKGGWYRDDLWNMKYLRGVGWAELMDGVRGEKREMEARALEERRRLKKEEGIFRDGVEKGKMIEGMEKKRKGKNGSSDEHMDVRRTWRQFEVKGIDSVSDRKKKVAPKDQDSHGSKTKPSNEELPDDVRRVLGKIF